MASVAGAFHITLSGRTCEFDTIKEVLGTTERFFFLLSFEGPPLKTFAFLATEHKSATAAARIVEIYNIN